MDNIIPSINDEDAYLHKPNIISRIFWKYGYLKYHYDESSICRKHIITGTVEVRRYNKSFNYWYWAELRKLYKKYFIKYKYW